MEPEAGQEALSINLIKLSSLIKLILLRLAREVILIGVLGAVLIKAMVPMEAIQFSTILLLQMVAVVVVDGVAEMEIMVDREVEVPLLGVGQ